MADENDELEKALRAPAKWETDGHGIRGPLPERITPPVPQWITPVREEIPQQDAPVPLDSQFTNGTGTGGDSTGNTYSFKLIRDGTSTTSVILSYGEINDTPPTEQSGGNDYTISPINAGDEVYGIITYDTTTLAITSRTIGWAASVPTSTFGTLYVPIGSFNIVSGLAVPRNRQCGDIKVVFIYGALNGARGLYALRMYDDAIAVP